MERGGVWFIRAGVAGGHWWLAASVRRRDAPTCSRAHSTNVSRSPRRGDPRTSTAPNAGATPRGGTWRSTPSAPAALRRPSSTTSSRIGATRRCSGMSRTGGACAGAATTLRRDGRRGNALVCKWCGAATQPFKNGRVRLYCSRQCGQAWKGRAHRERQGAAGRVLRAAQERARRLRHNAMCARCGAGFRRKHDNRTANSGRFCSNRCAALSRGEARRVGLIRPLPWRNCALCGTEFYARRSRQLCSSACRRPTYVPRETKVAHCCADCGTQFVADARGPGKRYCAACRCRRQIVERRNGKHRRRVRLGGAREGRVDPRRLLADYGGRCGICRGAIDPTKQVPHPKALTIDHIIPIAAGGVHAPRNCQPAHFICNSRKADRGAGQLRLVGDETHG